MSRLQADGQNRIILAGAGAAITKLLRNLHELNVQASVLALPWDGPLRDWPAGGPDWAANCTVTLLVPLEGTVPEFEDQLEEGEPLRESR